MYNYVAYLSHVSHSDIDKDRLKKAAYRRINIFYCEAAIYATNFLYMVLDLRVLAIAKFKRQSEKVMCPLYKYSGLRPLPPQRAVRAIAGIVRHPQTLSSFKIKKTVY